MEMLRLLDDLFVPVRDCNVSMVMSNNTGIYLFFFRSGCCTRLETYDNNPQHNQACWLEMA